ncbi:MAG: tandem-95 repeat protein, partial [Candidatus Magnetomorum sp.]|nr:tandem-95 repeat protein [Candidatus Magnetomorum sp.]
MAYSRSYPVKQRIKTAAVSVLWALLAVFCCVSVLNATQMTVCSEGCIYTNNIYASIQEAINAIDAINPAPLSATIRVLPGRYTETVTIGDYWSIPGDGRPFSKNNAPACPTKVIHLIGAHDANNPSGETDRDNASIIVGQVFINTLGSGVKVSGFTIDASTVNVSNENQKIGTSAVMIASGPGAEVQYNIIKNSKRFGIRNGYVNGEGHAVKILYNTIYSSKEIAILNHVGNNDVEISSNTIINGDAADGIACFHYDTVLSENTHIQDNSITGGNIGILMDIGPGGIISNNTVKNVRSFAILTRSQAIISQNSISSCKDGIRTEYDGTGAADRVEITGNTISYIEYSGINVCGANTFVSDNTVHHCNIGGDWGDDWDYASIHVERLANFDARNSIIQNNSVYNGINGIQVWADGVTVTGNTLSQFGFAQGGSYSDIKIQDNQTYHNSAIVIGTNFGTDDIDPTSLIIQDHEDTFYSDALNQSPEATAISSKDISLEEKKSADLQFNIDDKDTDTPLKFWLTSSNSDIIALSDIEITAAGLQYQANSHTYQVPVNTDIFLTLTHHSDQLGKVELTVFIDDATNTFKAISETKVFTIDVYHVNIAPKISTNTGATVLEGSSITLTSSMLDASDEDTARSSLVYTLTVIPDNGQLQKKGLDLHVNDIFTQIDIDELNIVYIHDDSETTSDAFICQLSDGQAYTEVIFSMTIQPVNEAPVAKDVTLTTLEDTSFEAILTCMDPEEKPCTFDIETNPIHGNIHLSNDGTFSYTPFQNDNGLDTFTYRAIDSEGLTSNTATISISITPDNDKPSIVKNTGLTVYEGRKKVITKEMLQADDVETDSDLLIYSIKVLPVNGQLEKNTEKLIVDSTFTQAEIASGFISYSHLGDEKFEDSFQFMVSDGELSTAPHSFSIVITPVNDQPMVENINKTILEDHTLQYTLMVSDAENTQCTFSIVDYPSHGTVQIINEAEGTFSYTPILNYTGSDSFLYMAIDAEGMSSDNATVSIQITPVNDTPSVVKNTGLTLSEDTEKALTIEMLQVDDPDTDADALVYSIKVLPVNGQLKSDTGELSVDSTFTQTDLSNGIISYRHFGDETIQDSFQFMVSDGELSTDLHSFSIVITPVNDQPIVENINKTLLEDHILQDKLIVTDAENTQCTFSIVDYPSHGTVQILNEAEGTFSYTPILNYTGSDSFLYMAIDAEGMSSDNATVSIQITPVNDTPSVVKNTGLTVDEGKDIVITGEMLQSDDPETNSDALVYSIKVLPVNGQLKKDTLELSVDSTFTQADLSSGIILYSHLGDENLEDSFQFMVSDGELSTDIHSFAIVVTPVNDSPVVANLTKSLLEDHILQDTLVVTDPENTQCTFSIIEYPSHGTVQITNETDGSFTYTPTQNYDSTDSFTYRAVDAGGLTSTIATVSIQITPVNDTPSVVK